MAAPPLPKGATYDAPKLPPGATYDAPGSHKTATDLLIGGAKEVGEFFAVDLFVAHQLADTAGDFEDKPFLLQEAHVLWILGPLFNE